MSYNKADCKSAGYAFDGSNPSPTTTPFFTGENGIFSNVFNGFHCIAVFEPLRFGAFAVSCVPFH
jgi:hypothetical protein